VLSIKKWQKTAWDCLAAEARRLADRFEIHYTPKHGSWLNSAEIEINVLTRQCLARPIPDHRETMVREVVAWQDHRNADTRPVNGRFTTEDARIKLKSLIHQFNKNGVLDLKGSVQVSFFGGLHISSVHAPDRADGPGIMVTSLLDIAAIK